jgi:predicted unusual protein kinase regulating ubiquinone biosynthesis (AarF/ABC1/UbiB family)
VDLAPKLGRYSGIASLLLRHRHLFASRDVTCEEAEQFARDLERRGATYVKLGQLLSTRSDLLAPPYLDALRRLQDAVKPFPFAAVERIVEAELGVRLSKAFGAFEREPMAAASLGQVHRAALRDGRFVAVKVQRPGIDRQVRADLEALARIADFFDRHTDAGARYAFAALVAEFSKALTAELDYVQEASNLRLLGRNLVDFDSIVVPQPVDDFTTSRVLTMEYVAGTKVTALSPLTRLDIDGERLGRDLVGAYLRQIVVDGFFHADPHPGNVFLTGDQRVALIDLGMVGHLSPRLQERLLQLLIVIADGQADAAADIVVELGERLDGFNAPGLRKEAVDTLARFRHATMAELEVGRLILEMNLLMAKHGLRGPSELALLGKTLLNLDQVARCLAPQLDVNDTIREHATSLMRQRVARSASTGGVLAGVLEAKQFAERLPGRINRVLDAVAANDLRLRVEMIDEGAVIEGLQKVANRIALGLVLAALILAAALIMQVPTSFRLLGYPGLAMILFILAATGGILLALQILLHDRVRRRVRR